MQKRIVGIALGTLLLALSILAEAQQPTKIPRIGFVTGGLTQIEAFRRGLRDLGYIEGKNILIEYRYLGGKRDRIPSLVAELVELKVDVLVASTPSDPRSKGGDQDDSYCHGDF